MSFELSYQTLKTSNQAREAEEIRTEARRKNLLILILHYLTEEGYIDTANSLEQETSLGLRQFEVCDNIDLQTILMEYESYYYVKFQRYPKLTKKLPDDGSAKLQPRSGGKLKRTVNCNSKVLPKISTPQRPHSKIGMKKTELKPQKQENGPSTPETSEFGLNVSTIKVGDGLHPRRGQIIDLRGMIQDAIKDSSNEIAVNSLNYNQDPSERLIKPLGAFIGASGEMRDLAVVVSRDIYLHNPNVRWDDIIGLEPAKRLVKEAVVYPIKYPQLFTGILSPWKGLLLYGPPASTIVSKWRGDSEKLVRVLFELARFHAPSTIFLDELESVMSQRGSVPGGEHEGSRRMKTELLVQMDGLARSDDLVFVLAASNMPWELDHAMLRRLEKRILVDLPSKEARQAMILHWLPPLSISGVVELRTQLDYSLLGQETEGYSGSDLKLVCKEAAMRPVRKIFETLENHQTGKSSLPTFHLETISTNDVLDVIIHTKPSAKSLGQKYTAWQHEYESV
ncbi:katanin p60 ATPase-containing subunit A-like 2 isoform X2 [Hypanus sabinus]|uniref:katanin p60 ATPase-containing subunit A-like 2 isoform X2 n=1 Tax=Hypanus sabinus TaxID=79690 RepID=UPI0028C4403F|nr:katanin p60 ATPase-containing subunit A-like 2 isoform X2 [Hypanus sabinus]